ncbi:RNA-binding protein 27-like [Arapaima gigas]
MVGHQNHRHTSAKLEVYGIPRDPNSVTNLNEYFSKFGTIINTKVMFGGNPKATLTEHTAHEATHQAASSTRPVLNKHFIKLYWHQHKSEHLLQLTEPDTPELYSSSVMEATSEPFGKTVKAQKATKKKKQVTLKLYQYKAKKKQGMLEIQIKCQKALINKLGKNKDMTLEERTNIMKTFKELMDKICLLKEELKVAAKTNVSVSLL